MNDQPLHFYPVPKGPRDYSKDEPMHPLQIARLRRMTPAEKLDAMAQLWAAARELTRSGIRTRHPDWTEEQVARELRDRTLYGIS